MMLEVQVADLLLRHSDQIEPANLCDLFALGEVDAPKSIQSGLREFLDRARAELAEINDGSEMKGFVDGLGQVEASRVPDSFRALLTEFASREGREAKPLTELLGSWTDTAAETFEFGAPTMKVQTAEAAAPKASRTRTRGIGKAETKPAKPKRKVSRPVAVEDVEKDRLIRELLIERLSTVASDKGLSETVLIAGIRHRAKSAYPRLGPHEVTKVLKDLEKRGLLRKSARRWFRP